jgi:hypothetical protein
VPPSTLHPARRIQLRKQSNDHAPSLPSTATDGKPGCKDDDNPQLAPLGPNHLSGISLLLTHIDSK